jgi:hypothetical protein
LPELIDESAGGIVILLIYQAPKPAMYSPAKGLAPKEAGKDHVQNRTRAYRCGWGSGRSGGTAGRWMQLERIVIIIKRAAVERIGGGVKLGARPGLELAGRERVRYPDGDLLLQPEPLRGRVA